MIVTREVALGSRIAFTATMPLTLYLSGVCEVAESTGVLKNTWSVESLAS